MSPSGDKIAPRRTQPEVETFVAIELSKLLQARGVDLVVLDQGIDTSTAIGRLFLEIIGAIAEFERALMSERRIDGFAAARARGRAGGQKPKLGPMLHRASRRAPGGTRDLTVQRTAQSGRRHS